MKFAILLGIAALVSGGPAAAETWQAYSRSQNNAFMADADSITTVDGITAIHVATVPRAGEGGDLSHSVETYQFQCAAGRWRTASSAT